MVHMAMVRQADGFVACEWGCRAWVRHNTGYPRFSFGQQQQRQGIDRKPSQSIIHRFKISANLLEAFAHTNDLPD